MSIHGSKNWSAVESTDIDGRNRNLVVTGDVEVGASNEHPVLTEAVPQGINPTILILDLATPAHEKFGSDVVTWKHAIFEKSIGKNQYVQVDIRDHALVEVVEEIA